MTLTNLSAVTLSARISFYANDGSQLTIPLTFPNSNVASTSSSFADLNIAANQTIFINTGGPAGSMNVGWADVQASGPLEGYAVFSYSQPGGPRSEGTVALDTRLSSSVVLPYDNTNGSNTAIALANQSATATTITATLLDQSGSPLGTTQIVLPALGHSSVFVTNLFSQAANRAGVIKFQNPSGNVTAVGLLFYPGGAFTSLPIIQ